MTVGEGARVGLSVGEGVGVREGKMRTVAVAKGFSVGGISVSAEAVGVRLGCSHAIAWEGMLGLNPTAAAPPTRMNSGTSHSQFQ